MAAVAMPPGSRIPGLVNAVFFARDPVRFLERQRRRYGNTFSLNFPSFGRLVYFVEPAQIKELFTSDPRVLHAGEANARALEPCSGRSRCSRSTRTHHMRQRKLLLPPSTASACAAMAS